MLKKYLSKFTVDILPSVFATVVGAYIVNYYIIPKAREDRPPATAAAASTPIKAMDAKPDASADQPVNASEAAQTAGKKPIDKAGTEKFDKAEGAKAPEKAAESRRHNLREKTVAKAEPSTAVPPSTPVVATVGAAPAGDVNDLARAAIERLSRGEKIETPRAAEAPRAAERTASVQPQPAVILPPTQQAQPMQQLPPPIVLSNPSVENPMSATERLEASRDPRPPGNVPVPMRGDLQANADDRGGRTNVVEDVLSGAKSMFDKVIPRSFER
jgi:hypothetical protein